MTFLFSLSVSWNVVKLAEAPVLVLLHEVTCRMETTSGTVEWETEGLLALGNLWSGHPILE